MKLWVVFGLTFVCGVARADNRPVYVDWSGVSDQAIDACKLRGLETIMVQSLIEEHFAVVGESSAEAISIAITTGPRSFELRGSAMGEGASDWVDIPKPCDSSIALTLTQRVVAMAHTLDAKTAGLLQRTGGQNDRSGTSRNDRGAGERGASDGNDRQGRPDSHGGKRPVEIAATAVLPGSMETLAGGLVRYNIPAGPMQLGVGADFVFWRGHDVTILEPDVAVAVTYGKPLGDLSWNVGLEAAAILHVFNASSDNGTKLDGRLGLPVSLGVDRNRVFLTVMPYTRADKLEHFVGGARIYTSEHWGVLARLGVGFGGP